MQQTKFLFSRRAPRMQMSDTSSRLLERRGLRKPPTLIEPSRFPSGRVGRGLIAAALPVLALLVLGAPASAQDPEQRIQSLEAQLRDLRTRIQQREFQFDEMERRLNAVEWSLQKAPIAGASPPPVTGSVQGASDANREREWRLLCYVQYDREVRHVFGCDEPRATSREEQCRRVQSEGLRKLLAC